MTRRCEFFESPAWDERIEAHVGRVWDLETTFRTADGVDAQAQIEELAEVLDTDPTRLALTPLGEVLASGGSDAIDLSIEDAAAVWRENREWLPEQCPHEPVEGTDRCHFHTAPARYGAVGLTGGTVADKLVEALRADDATRRCFVGAHTQELDLSGRHIRRVDVGPSTSGWRR